MVSGKTKLAVKLAVDITFLAEAELLPAITQSKTKRSSQVENSPKQDFQRIRTTRVTPTRPQ